MAAFRRYTDATSTGHPFVLAIDGQHPPLGPAPPPPGTVYTGTLSVFVNGITFTGSWNAPYVPSPPNVYITCTLFAIGVPNPGLEYIVATLGLNSPANPSPTGYNVEVPISEVQQYFVPSNIFATLTP